MPQTIRIKGRFFDGVFRGVAVLSDAVDRTLEFQCPKCAKRLKAGAKAAGKKFQCPACGQSVKVPGVAPLANKDDDWLSLDEPVTEPVKKEAAKPATARSAETKPVDTKPTQAKPTDTQTATPRTDKNAARASTTGQEKRSVFDDDLPQLAELEDAAPRTVMPDLLGVDLEELVPVNPKPPKQAQPLAQTSAPNNEAKKSAMPKKAAALDPANAQYRCACPSCGTPQYVTTARQGKMIRCPDCFTEFKIPPPPVGWKPTTAANVKLTTDLVEAKPADTQQFRSNAEDLLRSAEKELDDDDIDSMYDMDFDNATFMQRTFGFFYDSTAMFQIAMYSVFFALLFAAEFYCLAKVNDNRAYALVAGLCIPLLTLIISFPMFGTALTILESVANGQTKVREWQGFNFFDHIGEMMLFAVAAAVSAFPGFFVGGLLGQGVNSPIIVVLATMLTSFLTFPIVLLSMMDNESLVNPFSPDVWRSIRIGSEAWATYYFKTFVANFVTFVAWAMLLGSNPILSAIGGLLFPLLFFFTIQQLGVLAFDISEHLSFIVPDKKDEEKPENDRRDIDADAVAGTRQY